MQLWRIVFQQYRLAIVWLIVISIASAIAGVGVIAYIDDSLTQFSDHPWQVLYRLIGLLGALFVLRWISQFSLSYLGHKFVYQFRNHLIKRILDTDIVAIERIGSARLLASLSKDINSIQSAFMNLPGFVQGAILCIAAAVYLNYLAWDLFVVVLLLIIVVAIIGSLLVKKVYKHYKIVRDAEDTIYQDFESIIDGRKELSLNRQRAKLIYTKEYKAHARTIRKHIVYGDTFHFTALNWADTMILGSIGLVFFLAVVMKWADNTTATTFALTILFLKSPLIQSIGAIPTFLEAHVSFNKIHQLGLNDAQVGFNVLETTKPWQQLHLQDVSYHYLNNQGQPSFSIGPINLTLHKGEVIFLIGGNGSGKSTFAKILTGLYRPTSGKIFFDNHEVKSEDYPHYRQHFSAVYTDLHLFKALIGKGDELNDEEAILVKDWQVLLEMQSKLDIDDKGIVLNEELSQGQRKRLALLLAIIEQRELLLLDEWAADQDPHFRRKFYYEIIPKLKAMGKTLIVISHDDHYFAQADRLFQMKQGQLFELTGQDRVDASRDAIA